MSRGEDLTGLVAELGALGYPAPQPPPLGQARSFDWVADCLAWLCARAAPGLAVLPRDYSSEAARVAFFASLGTAFYEQTHIRLNLRRLYRAGGGAARELHRLATALRSAAAAVAAAPPLPAGPPEPAVLRRQLEAGLAAARQQAAQLEAAVGAAGQEVAVLEGRVEKRHSELDRLERRLDSLQAIKPAHSAEVEALEAELGGLYEQYLHKFRNLEYLEGVLDKHSAARQAEAEEADKQLRRIQRQVAAEELRLLQGASGSGEHGAAAAAALGALDSDDSEAELLAGLGGKKVLPRLGAGVMGAAAGSAGGAGAVAAAAAALDLLPEEDSGTSAAAVGGSGRSRLSAASDAVAPADGRVTWGGATQIPAHYGEGRQGSAGGAGGSAARPASARRTTGSGNALLRKAASGSGAVAGGGANGSGGSADVLNLDSSLRRGSLQPGDSDF